MASGHCGLPVRMALHPALIETVHMTLSSKTSLKHKPGHEILFAYLGHNLPSLIIIVARDEV